MKAAWIKLNRRFRMNRFFAIVSLMFAAAAITSAQTPTPAPSPVDPCADITTRATRAESRLRDWPALARYRGANATVTPPAKDENRVVFMGDSITDSWDDPKYGGFFPGKPYIDRGISGQTTQQMLIRFRRDVIELKPNVVVLLA